MTRKPVWIAAAAGTVAVVLGVVWFLGRSAPEGVDLEAAAAGLSTTTTSGDGEPAVLEGEWQVDPASRIRSGEGTEGTFVGYRVEERLSGVGRNTAVGRTGDVAATLVIDNGRLVSAEVEADLRGLRSDDGRRDNQVGQALDVARSPAASFTLTGPAAVEPAVAGEPFSVEVTGDLTIRGVTRRVEVTLQALVRDGSAVIVGEVPVTLADYGVQVPRVPIVLAADDHGIIELQLFLVRS
jgi:polyisoprenoid-binding protein YceI